LFIYIEYGSIRFGIQLSAEITWKFNTFLLMKLLQFLNSCRFKNGKELKASSRCVMNPDGEETSLTLKVTEVADAATYKCQASNKLGQVQTECTLQIQGK